MASALRKIFGITYTKQEDKENESSDAASKKRQRSSNFDVNTGKSTELEWNSEVGSSGASDETNSIETNELDLLRKQPFPRPNDSKKQCLSSSHADPSTNLPLQHTPNKVTLRLEDSDFDNDVLNFGSSLSEVESDVDSVSEFDTSFEIDKGNVQLCRKVFKTEVEDEFSDLEDRNDDQRLGLLLSYQMRIEKIERLLKGLLTEFQFHIEVSKIFNIKNHVAAVPRRDVSKVAKIAGTVKQTEYLSRGESPTGSWNLVAEGEDTKSKLKVKDQLLNVKCFIQDFVDTHLNKPSQLQFDVPSGNSSMTDKSDEKKQCRLQVPRVRYRVNRRKYERKMYEVPDLTDILHNLFTLEDSQISENNVTNVVSDVEEHKTSRCTCVCAEHRSYSAKSSDSGLPTKQSDTISSSIGDFTLDSSQLTAYSESLEHILSYDSYDDGNLISSMLRKSAIERIAFYVRVHNIQMTGRDNDHGLNTSVESSEFQRDDATNWGRATGAFYEMSAISEEANWNDPVDTGCIFFICIACHFNTPDEKGLLRHILNQNHCEKLHFVYKTAYIRRCFTTGQEIQPSTVLNSMTMYRDDNKIVCFGDNKFACSLCLLDGIIGESVLMSHCQQLDHVDRRNKLVQLFQPTQNQDECTRN